MLCVIMLSEGDDALSYLFYPRIHGQKTPDSMTRPWLFHFTGVGTHSFHFHYFLSAYYKSYHENPNCSEY